MGDLPVGPAHRRGNGLAHGGRGRAGRGFGRRARCGYGRDRFVRGRQPARGPGRSLHVAPADGPVRAGARDRGQVDAQFSGQLPGRGRTGDAVACGRFRCGFGCDRRCGRRCGRRLLFRAGPGRHRGRALPCPGRAVVDGGQQRTHRHGLAGLDEQLAHHPVREDLHLEQPLLGLDHGDDVAAPHPLSRHHQPLDQLAGLHVRAQAGHAKFTHCAPSSVLSRQCRPRPAGPPVPCVGRRGWAPPRCTAVPPAGPARRRPAP